MSQTRIGVVGLGSFCKNYHIPNLLRRLDIDVTTVCDVSQETLDARPEGLSRSQAFTDIEALLDANLIDGLVVSTSNLAHFGICKAALERDIPTLVDKPITVTLDHAEELVALSKERNVILMTAFTRHFMPSTEFVRRQIASGGIEVQALTTIQRRSPVRRGTADGGMLHRRTVHIADVLAWLTGKRVTSVSATIDYEDGAIEETFIHARLELEDGLRATFLGIKQGEDYQDEVNVYGVASSYRLERERLYTPTRRDGWQLAEDLPEYGNSTDYFVDAIQGKNSAEGDPYADRHSDDGLRGLRVIHAMHEAARTGNAIAIGE
jgi:predicted dehydrogenase